MLFWRSLLQAEQLHLLPLSSPGGVSESPPGAPVPPVPGLWTLLQVRMSGAGSPPNPCHGGKCCTTPAPKEKPSGRGQEPFWEPFGAALALEGLSLGLEGPLMSPCPACAPTALPSLAPFNFTFSFAPFPGIPGFMALLSLHGKLPPEGPSTP